MNNKISVAKQLFLGQIAEENIFPYPQLEADEAETLKMVLESIDRFLENKDQQFKSFDEAAAQPDEYLNALKELGLFSLIIPEKYEGLNLSATAYSRVIQQVSRYDASTSLTIGAHSSIGMKGILLVGNEEQKQRYLPKLASGELIAAFCLTEPGAGSDAASVKTQAIKNDDGSWTLNGEKLWITNGPFAGLFTVFAKTESNAGKMSAFIVEAVFPGVSTGTKEDKMGIRASATSSVYFNNVRVPAENLLGEEGKGFKIAMQILNSGRTGLGGGCIGGIKRCIEMSIKQAQDRKQFGQSISEFQLIKEKIAQMTVDCFTTEAVVTLIGQYIDHDNEDYSVEAAIGKILASEAFWRASNEALQIAGGNGYMRDFPYERLVRDGRINMIFEGTNEILRLYIGLAGMKDAGAYLKEIGNSAAGIFNDPIKGFGTLSAYASKKVTQLTSLGREQLLVADCLRHEAEILEAYTVEFGRAVEGVLKKYGKNIIGQQLITKRLADCTIDLFTGLATLARVNSMVLAKGEEACTIERKILKIFTKQARRRINQNIRRLKTNEDQLINELSEHIVERGACYWDII